MEIKYFGGNCIKIVTKKISVVIDDQINVYNKPVATDKDIVLRTQPTEAESKYYFLIDGPGEYEVSDISVSGVPAQLHVDEKGTHAGTIYRVIIDEFRIAVVGHIYPELSEGQMEELGTVDILVVPVGGNGYTLDGIGAQKIIRAIEPKIVIPTHYDDGKTKYEVPQADLETALKALSMEPAETVESLKLKTAEFSGETTRLIVIEPK